MGHDAYYKPKSFNEINIVLKKELLMELMRKKELRYGESNPELPRSQDCMKGGNVSRYTISDWWKSSLCRVDNRELSPSSSACEFSAR